MKQQVIGKTLISPLSFGSVFSHELRGDQLVSRLFGLIPFSKLHIGHVQYLRLATRDEVPTLYMLMNLPYFISSRRATCPVYVLQTKKRRRVLLKLKGDMHFKLRQVLGRQNEKPRRQRQNIAA